MRLASGIAPCPHAGCGVPIRAGRVDGSASNDGGHLLNRARNALLVQRLRESAAGMTRTHGALEIATRGGARVLGRDNDIERAAQAWRRSRAFRISTPSRYVGAVGRSQPSCCAAAQASCTIVNSRAIG